MIDQVIDFIRGEGRPAWLVGGYVRDQLLRRPTHDLDIIVAEGGVRLARRMADAFGGASFVLDAARDVGRAIIPQPDDEPLEVDVARLRAPELTDDLSLRDFTVNAIALDLSRADLPMFDPFDGRADLERRLLRAVTEGAFVDDPLRTLRGVRMAAELGFTIESATVNLVRRDAHLLPLVAPERIREELVRVLVAPAGWRHLRLLHELGLLQHVLPESAAQVGVVQSPPHYQDVFDHSRSVLAHLAGLYALIWPGGPYALPAPPDGDATVMAGPDQWADVAGLVAPYLPELREHLQLPLAAGRTRRDLLAWAAVAHDWGKPAKRTVEETGRVRFFDHDHWGALLVEARLSALKFSGDEIAYVARVTDLHMRPGELAHEYPFTRRAEYRYFRDASSTGPDIVLLSLADHLATHAPAPDAGRWETRVNASARLLDSFFRAHAERVAPAALLDGHQLMAGLGLPPGPHIGRLLEGLREAQATGAVQSEAAAWAWVRENAVQPQGSQEPD